MPTPKIENDMRLRIAAFLPAAIKQALSSYDDFMQQSPPSEIKDFSDHHKAAKVAIAHIELLIKLARWADLPDPDLHDDALERSVALAQAEIIKTRYAQELWEMEGEEDE